MKTLGNATLIELQQLLDANKQRIKDIELERMNLEIANKVLTNKIKERKIFDEY